MSTGTGRKRIRLHTGSISREAISAPAAETLRAGGWVEPPPAEPMSREEYIERRIGDKMTEGTVFAGISPETGKAMYTTPADAPLTMNFNEVANRAFRLIAYGHEDWRVPTMAELGVLFNNRAAIGGFNVTGPSPAG
jgi:hypothetical protein